MEDNLRFETAAPDVRDRPSEKVRPAWIAAALLAALAVVFQFFLRYEYVVRGPVLWRIDRVTREACRIVRTQVDCSDDSHSSSPSTSTSVSTSTSTIVVRIPRKQGH